MSLVHDWNFIVFFRQKFVRKHKILDKKTYGSGYGYPTEIQMTSKDFIDEINEDYLLWINEIMEWRKAFYWIHENSKP